MTQIKEFKIPCTANGQNSSVKVYMGNPEPEHNPITHQANFLAKERNITIPAEILETLDKLKKIAQENGVSFVELCEYALKSISISSITQPITPVLDPDDAVMPAKVPELTDNTSALKIDKDNEPQDNSKLDVLDATKVANPSVVQNPDITEDVNLDLVRRSQVTADNKTDDVHIAQE